MQLEKLKLIIFQQHAPRVILLSGTPALSRPAELFNQLKAVCPTLFRNFKSFAVRYCDGRQGRFAFEANGATNTQELAAILEKTIMIRFISSSIFSMRLIIEPLSVD